MREGTRGGEELEVDHLKTRAANAVPAHGAAPREVEDVGFKRVKRVPNAIIFHGGCRIQC